MAVRRARVLEAARVGPDADADFRPSRADLDMSPDDERQAQADLEMRRNDADGQSPR